MKKILVTGASGFIGSHCLPLLLERDYEIHAVSSKDRADRTANLNWHTLDLLNFNEMQDLMFNVQPTHLLHLAWYCNPGKWITSGFDDNLRWVQSSIELLKLFNKFGGERVVFTGSCNEYDWNHGYCSEFITPMKPNTFYGTCKHSLQTLFDSYSKENGLSSAWARIFFTYGPHEDPSRLVSSVILSILRNEPALCSHGNQIRDYLYVKDVSDSLLALLESNVSGPVNIASGRPVTIKEIVNKIAEKLNGGKLVKLGALPAASNDTPIVIADTSRLFEEVNWRPKYDLHKGLDKTINWWNAQINGKKF